MRNFLIALTLGMLIPAAASAQISTQFDSSKTVIKSSATIPVILVSSYTPTLVDTPQLAGSFVAEIQNRDASNAICCGFDAAFSTVTATAQAKGCRQIAANGGTWVVSRWWQNLRLYCQTLGTSGTSPVAVTQGN